MIGRLVLRKTTTYLFDHIFQKKSNAPSGTAVLWVKQRVDLTSSSPKSWAMPGFIYPSGPRSPSLVPGVIIEMYGTADFGRRDILSSRIAQNFGFLMWSMSCVTLSRLVCMIVLNRLLYIVLTGKKVYWKREGKDGYSVFFQQLNRTSRAKTARETPKPLSYPTCSSAPLWLDTQILSENSSYITTVLQGITIEKDKCHSAVGTPNYYSARMNTNCITTEMSRNPNDLAVITIDKKALIVDGESEQRSSRIAGYNWRVTGLNKGRRTVQE